MAMTVLNNAGTMSALGQLKKNDTTLGKQLKKVASGMKLNSAGDGASEYSISERMRVRIRALAQDEENVQTGARLLHTAEGGIQNQIDILKTIKAKVIDANNDTNTDSDRATIQKEINQGYQQIQDIATETSYNGRRVLFGGEFNEKITVWEEFKDPKLVADSSSMDIIPNVYDKLDEINGPFDIFQEFGTTDSKIDILKLAAHNAYRGAVPGTNAVYQMDFSNYTDVSQLDGVGFSVNGKQYVLNKDPLNRLYRGSSINIKNCKTVEAVLNAIASAKFNGFTAARNGSTVEFTATVEGETGNEYLDTFYGVAFQERDEISKTRDIPEIPAAAGTGYFSTPTYLSGGYDAVGLDRPGDPDVVYKPGHPATLSKTMTGLQDGMAIQLHEIDAEPVTLRFVNGTSGFHRNDDGSLSIGIDGKDEMKIAGMNVVYNKGKIYFESYPADEGSIGNKYYITDGAPGTPAVKGGKTETIHWWGGPAFSGTFSLLTPAKDGTYATLTVDLSNVPDTQNASDLEKVIDDLVGKRMDVYEFIDSAADARSLDRQTKTTDPVVYDLAQLRDAVAGGKSVRQAVRDMLSGMFIEDTSNTDADKIVLRSRFKGIYGNQQTLDISQGNLRSYDIDYGTWFQTHSDVKIPDDLYDKGFRWYCASDADHWFNVVFTDGGEIEDERPRSGTKADEIRTLAIDVSKVTNAKELVEAIYEQSTPLLTSKDPYYNHLHRLAIDADKGILTVYDYRRYSVNEPWYDYQEKGAKIADGVMDNVVKSTKDMLVDRIIIQHTDKASMNIRINIPRTTIDHIFTYVEDYHDVSEYNVMTKEMREKLLGKPPAKGILDKGIQYLTDANTLVGAQTNHLMFAHENIKTQQESTQASESTIRDSDMAKEMTNYTKANVLAQSAQAMLAQANSNAGNVISLLQ